MAANILRFPGSEPVKSDVELGSEVDSKGVKTEYKVVISQKDLCESTYILGLQGMGKSALISVMLLEQMGNDDSCIVIDPHGSLIDDLIKRMPPSRVKDVVLLDITDVDFPFSLNIFSSLPGQFKDAVLGQLMGAFNQVWPEIQSQQNFELLIQNLLPLILENEELTMIDIFRLLSDESFRNGYIAKTKNFMCRTFWTWQFNEWGKADRTRNMQAMLSRFTKLLSLDLVRNILCQRKGMINFRRLIEERKIVLIKLPLKDDRYKLASEKLGIILMSLIQAATFSFADIPNESVRPGFTLAVDELAAFSTTNTKDLVEGARKYKCKGIYAHQWLSQLEESGLGRDQDALFAAKTMVAFKLLPDDAGRVAKKKFSSVKRRGTNIYTNPLEQKGFKEHASDTVKDFYRKYAKRLEEAMKMNIDVKVGSFEESVDTNLLGRNVIKKGRDETYVYPSYDFGWGNVQFNPDEVRAVWNMLQRLFCDVQRAGCIDSSQERVLNEVSLLYATLVCADVYVPQSEREKFLRREAMIDREKLRAECIQRNYEQRVKEEEVKAEKIKDEMRAICDACLEKVEKKIREWGWLEQSQKEISETAIALVYSFINSSESRCYDNTEACKCDTLTDSYLVAKNRGFWWMKGNYRADKYRDDPSFREWEKKELSPIVRSGAFGSGYMKYEYWRGQLELIYSKRWGKIKQLEESKTEYISKWNYIVEHKESASYGDWQENRLHLVYNDVIALMEKTERERVKAADELFEGEKREKEERRKRKGETLKGDILRLLKPVALELIADPVAVDGGEDIEPVLKDLKCQYAYVNIGGRCYCLRVKDLPKIREDDSDLRRRLWLIRGQSRFLYARSRRDVEREIEAGFFNRGDEPPSAAPGVAVRPNKPSGSSGGAVSQDNEKRRLPEPPGDEKKQIDDARKWWED